MPKNVYFLKKGCKIAVGLRSQTPALLLPFIDIELSKYVFSVNLFYYFEK